MSPWMHRRRRAAGIRRSAAPEEPDAGEQSNRTHREDQHTRHRGENARLDLSCVLTVCAVIVR